MKYFSVFIAVYECLYGKNTEKTAKTNRTYRHHTASDIIEEK